MADGAPTVSRRRSRYSYFAETDPRFSDRTRASFHSDGGDRGGRARHGHDHFGGENDRKAARIAFTGEEFGFGYQAVGELTKRAHARRVGDGGERAHGHGHVPAEFDASSFNEFNFETPQLQPLRTREQALVALKNGDADFAVVPFFSPYYGYDFDSLRMLYKQFGLLAVEQIEATDQMCLAVYEPQLLDLVQSAHPGSGLSDLQKGQRRRGNDDTAANPAEKFPHVHDAGEIYRSGLVIDQSAQMMLRDRIDVIFAGPEALGRCKAKLDGFRAIGVDVKELPNSIEPHREMARLTRTTLNNSRQTFTTYDPVLGRTTFNSTMNAEAQNTKLYGVVLPFQIAMMSQEFVIVDPNIDDRDPAKTRFFVVKQSIDPTIFDEFITTAKRAGIWLSRLKAVAFGYKGLQPSAAQRTGEMLKALGVGFAFFGAVGVAYPTSSLFGPAIIEHLQALLGVTKWLDPLIGAVAVALGAALFWAGWRLCAILPEDAHGVRAIFRFQRRGAAASISDVENYLRNFGVRYATFLVHDDSEASRPDSIMLDVEFAKEDLVHGPRRLHNSVADGALHHIFRQWKDRGVVVVAAVPFTSHQLPKHEPRRWYSKGLQAWALNAFKTLIFDGYLLYLVGILGMAYLVWRWFGG